MDAVALHRGDTATFMCGRAGINEVRERIEAEKKVNHSHTHAHVTETYTNFCPCNLEWTHDELISGERILKRIEFYRTFDKRLFDQSLQKLQLQNSTFATIEQSKCGQF